MRPPRTTAVLLILVAVAGALAAHDVRAHESRPAYLEITQTGPARYDIVWRTPLLSGMRLPVALKLPDEARDVTAPSYRDFADSVVERRLVDVEGGLTGKRVEFVGLPATITDVLARVQLRDSAASTTLVHRAQPWLEITEAQGRVAVFGTYVAHGVSHILFGYDHLLFVFALMLIVSSTRVLVWTITAFTAAHSVTLALATLGVVHVPGPPVEATIALSILLLAVEILRVRHNRPSLTARWPWAVAFAFGLLHGFGFAGALTAIGLPAGDVPLALFAFNVGVELGQLAFVAAALALIALCKRLPLPRSLAGNALAVGSYGIGTLAAFWLDQRLAQF